MRSLHACQMPALHAFYFPFALCVPSRHNIDMNKLNTAERVQVVAALVEGNSINSTVRMTGISKPTILKLLAQLGVACQTFHDARVTKLKTKRVQCDELWAFCHCKKANIPAHLAGRFGIGD